MGKGARGGKYASSGGTAGRAATKGKGDNLYTFTLPSGTSITIYAASEKEARRQISGRKYTNFRKGR